MKLMHKLVLGMGERGQVAMMVAGMLPILLGMTGMSVDVATYMGDRRHLQNSADSMALAGAQALPDATAARTVAEQWAVKNGIDLNDVTFQISNTSDPPQVRVSIKRPHEFTFMQILGVKSRDVGAHAAAQKVSFGGGAGIVPWTVTQATVDAAGSGNLVTMKYDSTGANIGNFGAIRIDGTGSSTYEDSATFGSDTTACAVSAPNCTSGACPGSYPDVCSETSPTCDGAECTPETGNMIGGTRDAVDWRVAHTCDSTDNCGTHVCDSFAAVFGSPDASGKYHLESDCNPWIDGPGKCTSDADKCSRRVIIIPVVDTFGTGASDPAEVQRFALMFLEGYDSGKCQGSSCEIKGRFVQADITTGALAGVFDAEASVHFTRLSE